MAERSEREKWYVLYLHLVAFPGRKPEDLHAPGDGEWGTRFPNRSGLSNVVWRWLGLEGAVLLAALLCDLLIVFPAAFDEVGPKGRDLLLLPGIFAICGCALWGRKRPAAAALAGALTLTASTVLISFTDASSFSTLLSNLSLSETVAGLELVFFCVSSASTVTAVAAVSSLVVAALFAVFVRGDQFYLNRRLLMTLLVGAVLLVVVVAVGLRVRKTRSVTEPTELSRLVREQWPLTGILCLPLFLQLYESLTYGVRQFPLLLCSAAAAVVAILGTRYPLRAGLALSALIFFSIAAGLFASAPHTEQPLPFTEVLAGLVVVVYLIRYEPKVRAWGTIGTLSFSVALDTIVYALGHGGPDQLRTLATTAVLLLGLAVAIGLYFRARDSERRKVVEAAVTEAQTSERMALARELHDVVAHHVTGIVVQAQAAKLAGERNPALAMEALGRIEGAGTDALTAMRRLVRSMRSHAEDTQQATTDLAADLRRLIEAGHHGVSPEVDLRLPTGVPDEVGRSALRLVQESLTNVGKHATSATHVRVLAEVTGGELHLRVSDNGRTTTAALRVAGEGNDGWRVGGYGLVGMRERVDLLHGRLFSGPVEDGWLVEAWLPLEATTAD
jgi:signal transduction histidine kinase